MLGSWRSVWKNQFIRYVLKLRGENDYFFSRLYLWRHKLPSVMWVRKLLMTPPGQQLLMRAAIWTSRSSCMALQIARVTRGSTPNWHRNPITGPTGLFNTFNSSFLVKLMPAKTNKVYCPEKQTNWCLEKENPCVALTKLMSGKSIQYHS